MSKAVADRAREVPCIVINSTFLLAPWADMLYAADFAWWRHNTDAARFAGFKVSIEERKGSAPPAPGVRLLTNSGVIGMDSDPSKLRTGGNSGYQAIQIAAHAGAARILLCGFDMHGTNWHGKHAEPLVSTTPETYAKWVSRFRWLASELAARSIDVVNCTPGSALTCFRFMEFDDALAARAAVAA